MGSSATGRSTQRRRPIRILSILEEPVNRPPNSDPFLPPAPLTPLTPLTPLPFLAPCFFVKPLAFRRAPQLAENTARIALANFADYFLEIATLVLGAANAKQRSGKPKLRRFSVPCSLSFSLLRLPISFLFSLFFVFRNGYWLPAVPRSPLLYSLPGSPATGPQEAALRFLGGATGLRRWGGYWLLPIPCFFVHSSLPFCSLFPDPWSLFSPTPTLSRDPTPPAVL